MGRIAKSGKFSKPAATSNMSTSGAATAGTAPFSTTETKATNGCRTSSERSCERMRQMIRFMILFALACNVAFATETFKAKVGGYTYSYAITSNNCAVIMDSDAWVKIRDIQQRNSRCEIPVAISPAPNDKFKIPDSLDGHDVVEIGDWAFAFCSNIVSVAIPATVAKIGKYSFAGCLKLKSVEFCGFCLKEIDVGAFVGCSGLVDVALPDSVLSLGERSFSNCECLQKMKLSKELECIGDGAFVGDSCLRDVVLPPNLKTLGVNAFAECDSIEN